MDAAEERDSNMLYEDSDQEEFQECVADLARTVRWDLYRYHVLLRLVGCFEDEDDPTIKLGRTTSENRVLRPHCDIAC